MQQQMLHLWNNSSLRIHFHLSLEKLTPKQEFLIKKSEACTGPAKFELQNSIWKLGISYGVFSSWSIFYESLFFQ